MRVHVDGQKKLLQKTFSDTKILREFMHTIHGQHTGQSILAGTSVKNWRILLEQSFTAHMPLQISERC